MQDQTAKASSASPPANVIPFKRLPRSVDDVARTSSVDTHLPDPEIVPLHGSSARDPSLALINDFAPSRSLVDTLYAERGEAPRDVLAAFAREYAHQARTLETGFGRDQAIVRLRALIDAHVTHASDVCLAYEAAANRLIVAEVRAANADRHAPRERALLLSMRTDMHAMAIAARAAADAAIGASSALAVYIRDGLTGIATCEAEPRQMVLFAQTG